MKKKNSNFEWQGFIVTFILSILSIIFLIYTGFFNFKDSNDFIEYLSRNGLALLFALMFILFFIIQIIGSIIEIKIKKDVLYLSEISEDNIAKFINNKGKVFSIENKNYVINKYYDVLRSYSFINEVIGESSSKFEKLSIKKSYWNNFYLPLLKLEDILVLPFCYVILLIGILSSLLATGFSKIYGILLSILPAFLIIYDLIYKIVHHNKENNINKNEVAENKAAENKVTNKENNTNNGIDYETYNKIKTIDYKIHSVISIFFIVLTLTLFYFTHELLFKVLIIPFIIISFAILGKTIADFHNKENLSTFYAKLVPLSCLSYWFILCAFATYQFINTKDYLSTIVLIPFYIVGIVIFCIIVKKK